jgi:mono/diheme cytochrome c family protein
MKTNTNKILLAFTATCLFALACNKTDSAPSGAGAGASNEIPAAATKKFTESCAPCHGPAGHGDGPASSALNPKPRNYSDKAWQASVTDEQIRKTIIYGGAAVGKSPNMPSSPDLDSKPEVVDGLVKIVRSFGK